MELIKQQMLTGERALFHSKYLQICYSTFADGKFSLKDNQNVKIDIGMFKCKYPLWCWKNIVVDDSTLLEMTSSGIWHADNMDTMLLEDLDFKTELEIKLENALILTQDQGTEKKS